MTDITIEQGDRIRQAWYVMDGISDRPSTIAECHDMIESLLGLLGEITGITNAAAISPSEETAKDDEAPEPPYCPGCGGKWPGTAYVCNSCGWSPKGSIEPLPF